jgi:subtilisin family serine protease/regulation of enolase protein 1 (concanavalin A-like superfamily)
VLFTFPSNGFAQQASAIRQARDPIPGRYIVVMREAADARAMGATAAGLGLGEVTRVYDAALNAFAVRTTPAAAEALARDPRVAWVEEDGIATISAIQQNPPWGLDRTDQRRLPLDLQYAHEGDGAGVNVYVIDTGIRATHVTFTGRASVAADFVDDDGDGDPTDVGNDDADPTRPDGGDCHGHGTHVAGTIGGVDYGIAKQARLWGLRVLDCDGSAPWSAIIAAIDWVTANHQAPAVANVSIQGGASDAVDAAVRRSIAAGVTYAVAAGNFNEDNAATSPGRTAEAITVGAAAATDARAAFSNFGPGLDLFAPGVGILSASHASDTAAVYMSGTSMASPHVVGVAALYLQKHATATPRQVRDALVAAATSGVVSDRGTGSPNRLLYSGFLVTSAPTPPSVTVIAPNGGERLSTGTPYTIQWSASDPDGLSRFDVMVSTDGVNYSIVCTGVAGSRRSCTWSSPGPVTTTARIRVTAYDTLGAIGFDVSNAPFTIVAPPPMVVPSPWTSHDIGAVAATGSATHSNGTFTVEGSGADIWGTADEFHYVHRTISGNFQIEARVASVQNLHAWTKAGLMIREGLTASARHASIVATPGTTRPVSFQRRATTNGSSVSTAGAIQAPPVWLRLVRAGNVVTAHYRASNTGAWTMVGQQTFKALSSTLDVGLAVSAHLDGRVATATFDSVSIAPSSFTSADIGAVGVTGSTTVSGGTVTIAGGGADIWGTADAFRFYHTPWSGDGTVTVRVRSLTNVNAWTKAGLMFRESTSARSKHIMVIVSPGRGISVQARTVTGGTSTEIGRQAGAAPEWLRIRRAGGTFSFSASEDGITWRNLASSSLAMAGSLLVGLPVSSHNATTRATAVFSDFSIAP